MQARIKIELYPKIIFRFNKNMQGERCMMMHDVTMTRKQKEQAII
jgi:hypothetical protein